MQSGGRTALPGPSYIWRDPGRGCRQGRTEDEQGGHRVKPDLGQPGNPAPNNVSLQRLMCPLSKSISAAIRHLVTGFVCHNVPKGVVLREYGMG